MKRIIILVLAGLMAAPLLWAEKKAVQREMLPGERADESAQERVFKIERALERIPKERIEKAFYREETVTSEEATSLGIPEEERTKKEKVKIEYPTAVEIKGTETEPPLLRFFTREGKKLTDVELKPRRRLHELEEYSRIPGRKLISPERSIRTSPDNRYFAVTHAYLADEEEYKKYGEPSYLGNTKIYNDRGELLWQVKKHEGTGASIGPNGNWLIAAKKGEIIMFMKDGREIEIPFATGFHTLHSPSGKFTASKRGSSVILLHEFDGVVLTKRIIEEEMSLDQFFYLEDLSNEGIITIRIRDFIKDTTYYEVYNKSGDLIKTMGSLE